MLCCLFVCVLCLSSSPPRRLESADNNSSANFRTKILDLRGFDSNIILILRGGIIMSIGQYPGMFESTNLSKDHLSRDNLSREIGRTELQRRRKATPSLGGVLCRMIAD